MPRVILVAAAFTIATAGLAAAARHHRPDANAAKPSATLAAAHPAGGEPEGTGVAAPVAGVPDPVKVVAAYLDNLPPPPARESIRGTIDGHDQTIDACLAGAGVRASGRVVVHFTVAPGGKAHDGAVDLDELANPTVSSCMLGAVMALTYPRQEGVSTDVTFPLVIQDGVLQHAPEVPE